MTIEQSHPAFPQLYSPDLDTRYRATIGDGPVDLARPWPIGCDGAANAFLALIGPSPGAATPGEAVQSGGANRPLNRPMQIARDVIDFNWGDQRVTRWTRLCAAMLGGESYVRTLTALLNLDWQHSADGSKITSERLRSGFSDHVWPLLPELRPRIVCALTNSVWDILRPAAERLRVPFASCPVHLSRPPVVFMLPGAGFNSILVKPHNHPSRHFLSEAHIADVGKACQWFLEADAESPGAREPIKGHGHDFD